MKALLSLMLLSLSLFGQTEQKIVGVIPHYAVGAEWSSTLYLTVGGGGCEYRIDFMNTSGQVNHSHTIVAKTLQPWLMSTVKYEVPSSESLRHGPILIWTNRITEEQPYYNPYQRHCWVDRAELVFSAVYPGQKYDGSVRMNKTIFSYPRLTLDSTFQYGIALYNHSSEAVNLGYMVSDAATGGILRTGGNIALGAKEQKIFVLNTIIPEAATQMATVQFLAIPTMDVYATVLKFNSDRGFSTVDIY